MTRIIPFIYNSSTSYKIEFGYKYAKFILNDAIVCQIVTPYIDTDLLRIHYQQIGNTMRLVHPSYPPQIITRVSTSLFNINDVPFTIVPFMTRNDLADLSVTNVANMKYTGGTAVNSLGNLFCCKSDGVSGISFFDPLHVGALFKITTKRTDTVSAWSFNATNYTYKGVTTYTISDATFLNLSQIEVYGTYTFTTSNFIEGTNEGTIVLERSENGSDWENVRSELSSVIYSGTEKSRNVYYRSRVLPAVDGGVTPKGTIKANITLTDPTFDGIVKVVRYIDAYNVVVKVLSKLDSTEGTKITKRWAEGVWSNYRTWPTSITFFEDRCIYGGMQTLVEQVVY